MLYKKYIEVWSSYRSTAVKNPKWKLKDKRHCLHITTNLKNKITMKQKNQEIKLGKIWTLKEKFKDKIFLTKIDLQVY